MDLNIHRKTILFVVILILVVGIAFPGYRYFWQKRIGLVSVAKNGSLILNKIPAGFPVQFAIDSNEKDIQYWQNSVSFGGSYLSADSAKNIADKYETILKSLQWVSRKTVKDPIIVIAGSDPKNPKLSMQILIVARKDKMTQVSLSLIK